MAGRGPLGGPHDPIKKVARAGNGSWSSSPALSSWPILALAEIVAALAELQSRKGSTSRSTSTAHLAGWWHPSPTPIWKGLPPATGRLDQHLRTRRFRPAGAVARRRRATEELIFKVNSLNTSSSTGGPYVPARLTARFSGWRGPHLSRVRFPPFSRHNVPATPRHTSGCGSHGPDLMETPCQLLALSLCRPVGEGHGLPASLWLQWAASSSPGVRDRVPPRRRLPRRHQARPRRHTPFNSARKRLSTRWQPTQWRPLTLARREATLLRKPY